MAAIVINPSFGIVTIKHVKNLGWLIKHASDVATLRITDKPDGIVRDGIFGRIESIGAACFLEAWLTDGRVFVIRFNCLSIARQWVKRPSLQHAKVIDDIK